MEVKRMDCEKAKEKHKQIEEIAFAIFQYDTRNFLRSALEELHMSTKAVTNINQKIQKYILILSAVFSPLVCDLCKKDVSKRIELLAFVKVVMEELEKELRNSITPTEDEN